VAAPRLGRSGRRWPVSANEGHSQERPPAGMRSHAKDRGPARGPTNAGCSPYSR
jgi:hypothetical protein